MALEEQTAQLALENERLEREIACAEETAVVERVARTQLGLVKPGEISLPRTASSTVRTEEPSMMVAILTGRTCTMVFAISFASSGSVLVTVM